MDLNIPHRNNIRYLYTEFVQPKTAQFVQPTIGQMPKKCNRQAGII